MAACVSIGLATASMLYLLITSDFSVSHVANSTNRDLPIFYKIAALWGAHDGSMLLWVFVTAVFSGVVIYQNRFRYRDMMPYVVAVLMLNLAFFLALNLFLSNPFNQLVQVNADGSMQQYIPADGRGLNPLLQYWAMVIHPPILYLGFIGFVVPFAFATAALITRQLGDSWIRTTRRYSLLTWLFLGAGLLLGAKWAYVVLGWGGYWGWDPVENSSLMPWLIATAYLHSVIIQERKGMLKVWNMILVLLCYLLGIFGTFITRSGVVSSVHAFADSPLGEYFLIYMAMVAAGSLYLIIDRRALPEERTAAGFRALARERLPVQQPDARRRLFCRPVGNDVPGSLGSAARQQDHGRAAVLQQGEHTDRPVPAAADRRGTLVRLAQDIDRKPEEGFLPAGNPGDRVVRGAPGRRHAQCLLRCLPHPLRVRYRRPSWRSS